MNCWVINHCLEVSCKVDQTVYLQLTNKQWFIRGWHKNLISTCPGCKLDFISACPPSFELAPGGKLDFIYSLPPRFWTCPKIIAVLTLFSSPKQSWSKGGFIVYPCSGALTKWVCLCGCVWVLKIAYVATYVCVAGHTNMANHTNTFSVSTGGSGGQKNQIKNHTKKTTKKQVLFYFWQPVRFR